MLPDPRTTADGKSVQVEVMATVPPDGSSSAAAIMAAVPAERKGRTKVARACFGGWHPGSIFAQMGQDQAQVTKEMKLGYYLSEGHISFMAKGQLQPKVEQDCYVLKFMGQAQSQRGKGGEFGKEVELPYFTGRVQSEPNFDLAFGDKEAYWVMTYGLYFKQWDLGGITSSFFVR